MDIYHIEFAQMDRSELGATHETFHVRGPGLSPVKRWPRMEAEELCQLANLAFAEGQKSSEALNEQARAEAVALRGELEKHDAFHADAMMRLAAEAAHEREMRLKAVEERDRAREQKNDGPLVRVTSILADLLDDARKRDEDNDGRVEWLNAVIDAWREEFGGMVVRRQGRNDARAEDVVRERLRRDGWAI